MDEAVAEKAPAATLYLIRHGETEVNRRNCVQGKRIDPPLNERGRRQAGCVGERFRSQSVDWIVTSAALRAIETGAAIGRHHPAVPIDSYSELNELEFGDLEGTHVTAGYNDLVALWDNEHRADLAAPGAHGESPAQCAQRAMPRLQAIVKQAAAEGRRTVCVVVHSRLIQILLAQILDGSLATMRTYKQKKAAVNTVDIYVDANAEHWPFRCVAREINSTAHMPDDVVSRVSSATSLQRRSRLDERVRFEIDNDGSLVLKRL
ncbi:hypothetical protein IW140_000021 [Coemansia sp. RSA 1813]|nr:hypothetical protein EV178_000177 [Coemansia sp. RSA 1646]KAJ1771354.1 hypothetical protein LPJ74_002394 [Coemansia sp. RSA 1843]KAJ2093127.1 hypothetical protein IW138_000419 [Coemansia sp. RSA 986]KAJ2217607.1 hypothetical protein EV179_000442 [Coemansia sp. RSA 487]KAJ2573380.1 hypothetical protein IW140_000021 [Coemansia sp. RSA 1813]